MAQYMKRPHTYRNGITSENSDENKVRTRPHARPPSKHVPSLATRSPISQRREHGTKQASGLQIPTANERCAALWVQAVWLQSPLPPLPGAAFIMIVLILILGIRLCASPSPSSRRQMYQPVLRNWTRRLPCHVGQGEGSLVFSDPLSSIGREEASCYREEGHIHGFSHSSKLWRCKEMCR